MVAHKRTLNTAAEVADAVDDLLVSLGLVGPARPIEDGGFDGQKHVEPTAEPRNATEEKAPSAGVDALWGLSPKPSR